MRSPKVFVVQLFIAWRLEGVNLTSLWVHAGHNVLDHAILSGGVQTLEDHQDGPAVLRVEFFLQMVEHAFACIEYLLRVLLTFDAGRVSGVPILQTKLFTPGYTKRCCEARGLFDELVAIHGFGSVVQTCRSEQRAQSPAESGEAVSGEKDGFVRETDGAVEAEQIQSVVSAKRNIDTGHGPAEFDSRGAVKHAVG
jgi:hypothetical protein